MTSPAWALQTAIHSVLSADSQLAALLGGPKVYDDVPRGTKTPYVTFGVTTERDWSTGAEGGNEHDISLHVWSEGQGRQELQGLIAAVRTPLHDRDLQLIGHRLINLRHVLSEVRREADGETWRGLVRLRAATEPLP